MIIPNSIVELSKAIQSGELDALDFISRVLDEVDAIDLKYHVLAASCKEQALAQAKEIQKAVLKKRQKDPCLGCRYR